MKKWLGYTLPIIAVLVLACGASLAQKKTEGPMDCRDWGGNDRLQNHCEIKEQTVPAGGTITVDAGQNGGVAVKAWDRNEVLVRTRIQTAAPTQSEAETLAKEVRIETAGLRIRAEGPSSRRDYYWSVSYEIFAPRRSD